MPSNASKAVPPRTHLLAILQKNQPQVVSRHRWPSLLNPPIPCIPTNPPPLFAMTSALLAISIPPRPHPILLRQIHAHLPSRQPHTLFLIHIHPRVVPLQKTNIHSLGA